MTVATVTLILASLFDNAQEQCVAPLPSLLLPSLASVVTSPRNLSPEWKMNGRYAKLPPFSIAPSLIHYVQIKTIRGKTKRNRNYCPAIWCTFFHVINYPQTTVAGHDSLEGRGVAPWRPLTPSLGSCCRRHEFRIRVTSWRRWASLGARVPPGGKEEAAGANSPMHRWESHSARAQWSCGLI